MSIIQMATPAQVDIQMREIAPEPDVQFEVALSGHIRNCFTRAASAKQEIIERLLRADRQRKGEYDPDRLAEIRQTGGSDLYMMLTDIKCNAAENWIKDVLMHQDKFWGLVPSNEPVLPPEIGRELSITVNQELNELAGMGIPIHPEAPMQRIQQLRDKVIWAMRDEAKEIALRMEDKIEDQLNNGGFDKALVSFIRDFCTYPAAILKGPMVRRRKKLSWGEGFQPVIITDLRREVVRVSPYDIFPSPASGDVDEGYIIERHRLMPVDLESMRGLPGWSATEIEAVLAQYQKGGLRHWTYGDSERERLESKSTAFIETGETIEALEFWGDVPGEYLIQWGKTGLDPVKQYPINAWLIGSHVIRAEINPDPLGRRPYERSCWEEIPGAFWGIGLPEKMRDIQILCNASGRALANNMGISSGPQVEVTVDRLPDGEPITNIYPWKIWQTTTDKTGGGQPAVRFFQPNMNAPELMNIYMTFKREADEVTGIPNYVYGSTAVGGAGRTASGLSMLMENASKGIKQAISHIDRAVRGVLQRFYVHNMLYDPDPTIKGDCMVETRGALGAIMRETLNARRNEFLAATANAVDLQIIGVDGRAELLREMARGLQMDADRLVPSRDKLQSMQQAQAQAAAQQMQQQQAQSAAPPEQDVAGNPAGGVDANLVQ